MATSANIVADSIGPSGVRIVTMELIYPRFIHAEFMTHRVFSRNASSSRAIPVKRMLAQVWSNPAMPIHWGANQAGMQADEELQPFRKAAARFLWKAAGRAMCVPVWLMSKIGLHKQVANRLLEPWQHIHVVVTATEWENFFALRCHNMAQPEIKALADAMKTAQAWSRPVDLKVGEWHLPYVNAVERSRLSTDDAIKVSAARCCRVSYLNHGGLVSTDTEDFRLYDRLMGAEPPHMSPIEHQAEATVHVWRYANFISWRSHRYQVEMAKL